MLDQLFISVLGDTITASSFMICTVASLILGAIIAAASMYKSTASPSFIITLAIIPAVVQMIIMLVNGNIGAGIAVMGAFNLVRFRSIPGTAKEICGIFMAMAVGLATGMGQIAAAVVFTILILIVNTVYLAAGFGKTKKAESIQKAAAKRGAHILFCIRNVYLRLQFCGKLFRYVRI